ncbi:MAG TPA: LysR family transcriptional regulator [Burkholderiales bacterium]|nr:LysR family transcriptional regulator [Burkholderiales bacterium]
MQVSDRVGRRIKLQDLHVLMVVVQAGSMSKAAVLMHTTQSAISRSIASLEQTFGVRLLDRSRQGVEPTEHGRALLDGGAAVFDELRQAVKNVEFLSDPTAGEVRVGAHEPFIAGLLPAVIDRLRRKHSGISVLVAPIAPNAERFLDLRERKIDLLLDRIAPRVHEDISVEVLFHDRVVVVSGPNSRWARQRKIELSALIDEAWVLPRLDTIVGPLVADAFGARGVKFPPKGAVWGGASLFFALLARSPFLGTVPVSLLQFGANLPRLKVLPVELPIPRLPVGIMTLKNRTLTPVVRLFIDCVHEVVKPLANTK